MSLGRVGLITVPAGAKVGFDHADTYRPGRRIYVAHTGAGRVDVLDCERRTYLRSLPDLRGVAGVLVDQQADLLFTSDRAVARISITAARMSSCSVASRLGPHPNGLAYDSKRRALYGFNLGEPLGQNCTASIVDVDSLMAVAEVPLPGRPRWAVYDPERDVVYANIRAPAQIAVIDCNELTITRALVVPSAGPHGLWLDRGRLFCATDGGALVVLDRDSGEIVATLPLPGEPDVLMHDPDLQRLYVAIGDPGVVCSFDSERLEPLETVHTEPGAHTIGWDPDSRSLYVFCPASGCAAVYEERT